MRSTRKSARSWPSPPTSRKARPNPNFTNVIPTCWWSNIEMAIELKMPALSPTMEEGTLAKWLVKEGDTVKSGDILAEIETDKATMAFEAIDEGTIGKILVAEGTDNVKEIGRAACRERVGQYL